MPTVTVTSDTVNQTIADNEIVLLDFWADWCGPCKQFAPVFERSSDANSEITYGKVDTEDQYQLAVAAQITSVPTLMAFKRGVTVYREAGALPPAALEDLVKRLKELDLDAALAAAAAESAAAESANAETSDAGPADAANGDSSASE